LEELIMNKQTKVWLVLSIALSLLALGSACGGGKDSGTNQPASGEATTAASAYSGPTGSISGVVSYNGTPPAPKKIDTTADAACGKANPNLMTDDTIVKDGKLANVFVYVKEGTVDGGKKLAEPATFAVSARRDLWVYLVIAALVLLMIEWVTYHRRITV
jgi:hypothetical protein